MKRKITRELLYSLYWEQGLSMREMATNLGYSPESKKSIARMLRKFNIPIRTRSQAYHNAIEHGKEPFSFEPGYIPWNYGITAKDDPRITHGKEHSTRMKEIGNQPEERKRRSERLKGKPKSKEHRKHISEGRKGIKFSDEHKEKLRQATLRQKPHYRNTSIEIAIQQELNKRNIHFETHLLIEKICRPDIIFLDHKLVIFCDGMYWHNQSHVSRRDRRQEKELLASDWRYLRFTDTEINNDAAKCVDIIETFLIRA